MASLISLSQPPPGPSPTAAATEVRPGAKGRILVAMSGGVDSAYAAVMLAEEGYDLVGVHMATSPYAAKIEGARFNSCCSPRDAADARAVAIKAGFPFYTLDLEREFREAVIDPFVDDYLHGRTPNPCVLCNNKLKLGHLLDRAHVYGAHAVATGHYAITEFDAGYGQWVLRRPVDRNKDQTYYLFGLTTSQVQHFRCPLGGMTKDEVRARAQAAGLAVHDKPDSQEICFVPDNNYRNFLRKAVPDAEERIRPGDIVTSAGEVVGQHTGTPHYTVGQRKGLGIAHSEPLYVLSIDPKANVIVVGPAKELGSPGLLATRVNWQIPLERLLLDGATALRVSAQIRYRAAAITATVSRVEADSETCEVIFDEPQQAVTPGQAVVFYDAATNATLWGGGWISCGFKAEG